VETKSQERRNVVASGKTVQDAITNGLTMLGVRRDQVDVEILSEGSRGVLGFGAENARVRLLVKAPAPPARPVAPAAEPLPRALETKVTGPVAPSTAEAEPVPASTAAETLPADKSAPERVGQEILSMLLSRMGIRATVETRPAGELAEDGQPAPSILNISGDDLGVLIGRRGETLWALQYLVRLMVSHRLKHWSNLVVDVEEYRVRRHHALESLAARVAEEVARSGKTQALEPMPPYERRLVHIALRNHPKVSTHSIGQGEQRKVTIIPRR
jgi:spoIIIJ-associated protein